jgi:prepilin-type N-terminal cleavage/methylation domain-containing protein
MTTLNSRLQLALLNRKRAKKNAEKGFTLIELLISVVILGVLSAVAVPGFIAQKNKADVQAANAQGRALMAACKTFLSDSSATIPTNIYTPGVSGGFTKRFGNITWSPTVNTTAGSLACSSSTSGQPGQAQSFVLDMTTGDMSTDTPAT